MQIGAIKKLLVMAFAFLVMGGVGTSENVFGKSNEWDVNDLTPVTIDGTGALGFHIHYLHRQGLEGQVSPLTNGSILRSGDPYKIIFTPRKKCYVYIFQIDSSETIKQLFPESVGNNSNPVQDDKTYYVPAKEQPLRTIAQPGLTTMYFLASQRQDVALEDHYQAILSAKRQPDALREKLALEEFTKTLQGNRLASGITFAVNTDLVADLPLNSPTTEQDIIKALSIKPPTTLSSTQEQSSKPMKRGLDRSVKKDLPDNMPRVGVFHLFEENSATIAPESYPLLHEYGKALQDELKDVVLVIAGHTEDRGSDIYTLGLSKRRAEAVKHFLVSEYQIAENRLVIKPYGKSEPIAPNDTAEGQRLNNRIEFIRIQ
jgi:outer membrane protein OmpA-like peptidoglycan-associated protein